MKTGYELLSKDSLLILELITSLGREFRYEEAVRLTEIMISLIACIIDEDKNKLSQEDSDHLQMLQQIFDDIRIHIKTGDYDSARRLNVVKSAYIREVLGVRDSEVQKTKEQLP